MNFQNGKAIEPDILSFFREYYQPNPKECLGFEDMGTDGIGHGALNGWQPSGIEVEEANVSCLYFLRCYLGFISVRCYRVNWISSTLKPNVVMSIKHLCPFKNSWTSTWRVSMSAHPMTMVFGTYY